MNTRNVGDIYVLSTNRHAMVTITSSTAASLWRRDGFDRNRFYMILYNHVSDRCVLTITYD